MPTRVILADDHRMVRQGLRALLEMEGFQVAGEASDGHEAIRLASRVHPDVALLDLAMPLLNGMDAARGMLRLESPPAVIALTAYEDDQHVMEALRAGVQGYILKTRAVEDLVAAIREVMRGGMYLGAGCSRKAFEYLENGNGASKSLSDRERQVVQLVAEGKTTKEIAALLCISAKTADSHRTRAMKKLDIHDVAGLVRYAIREGFILP